MNGERKEHKQTNTKTCVKHPTGMSSFGLYTKRSLCNQETRVCVPVAAFVECLFNLFSAGMPHDSYNLVAAMG